MKRSDLKERMVADMAKLTDVTSGRLAIGYCRVSTEAQASDGESLAMQSARIAEYCQRNGWNFCGEYSDRGISGKDLDARPEAQRAIEHACRCRGVLVVYSLSRLSRSLKDTFEIAEKLQSSGAEIVSLKEQFDTTTATGRMIFGILAVLDQFEREITRERTIDTLRQMKGNGQRVGRYPQYGYRLDESGTMKEDAAEQMVIRKIREWHGDGESPRGIAHRLNAIALGFRGGKLWKTCYIKRILGQ